MNERKTLTIVVPCYNEEDSVRLFYEETKKHIKKCGMIRANFLFVDDGSGDQTLQILKDLNKEDESCNYITFSRNFGKEAAMYAGLREAKSDFTVIMDADLQHPPELLPQMIHAVMEEGYECCAGFRMTRDGEGFLRNTLSKTFYKIISSMSKVDMDDGAGDFRMMSRKMVDAILACKEYNRYMKGIFSFVGFETKWISFENIERVAGETKWGMKQLFRYALDGLLSFSTAPISMAAVLGGICFVLSFAYGIYLAITSLVYQIPTSEWGIMMCVLLFLSGIQLLFISIVGGYASKNYLESKGRPIYIIKEQNAR